jgi:hypothetical protein
MILVIVETSMGNLSLNEDDFRIRDTAGMITSRGQRGHRTANGFKIAGLFLARA